MSPQSNDTSAKASAARNPLVPLACVMLAVLLGCLVPTLVVALGVPFAPLLFLAVACALAIYATRRMGDDTSARLLWGSVVGGVAPLSTTLFSLVTIGRTFQDAHAILLIVFFALVGGALAVLASHFQT